MPPCSHPALDTHVLRNAPERIYLKSSLMSNVVTRNLDHLKSALQVLGSLGDGAIGVPALKAATEIAIQIIEIAEAAKSNQESCRSVAERVNEIVLILIKERTSITINSSLRKDLDKFTKDLEEIAVVLSKVSLRSFPQRHLKATRDAEKIQECKEKLQHSFEMFNFTSNISMRKHQQMPVDRDLQVDLPPGLSTIPPPMPSVFYGRDDFVNQAVALIQSSEPTRLAITGTGGIGKTSIALAILHHKSMILLFDKHRYFVPCEGAKSPDMLVACILQVLAVPQNLKADSLALLHNFLALSGNVLLVLDNMETPYEESEAHCSAIDSILQRIAAISNVTLVITKRGDNKPMGIDWDFNLSNVVQLSLEAAQRVFEKIAGINLAVEEQSGLHILLKNMDGVPLAITLMAHLGRIYSIELLLKRWENENIKLLRRPEKKLGRSDSVEVSISISIEYTKDVPEAVDLLAMISFLPDGILDWENKLNELATGFDNVYTALDKLISTSLAYKDPNGTLKVLSPICHYMMEHHPIHQKHLHSLVAYYFALIDKYGHVSYGPDMKVAVKQLFPETVNIISLLKHIITNEKPPAKAIEISIAISEFLWYIQPTTELLQHIEKHFSLLQPENILYIKRLWGSILYCKNKYSEAEKLYEDAKNAYENIGNQSGAAWCQQSLGDILYMQDKYAEAEKMLGDAMSIFEKIGNQLGAAQCQQGLGNILRMQNKYAEAEKMLEDAMSIFEKIGNQLGAAQCQQSLGNILRMQNKYAEAEKMLGDAMRIFGKIGDQSGAAWCQQSLGNILCMQDKYAEAEKMLGDAISIFGKIGDQSGAAWCQQSLGGILRMQNKYAEAEKMLGDAMSIFEKVGNQSGAAWCQKCLGDILYMQDKYAEAEKMLGDAMRIFGKIGDQSGAAWCQQSLGNILRMQDKYAEAEKMLGDAMSIFEKIGDQSGAAQCQKSLGDILHMQNKYAEAEKMLGDAMSIFEKIGNQSDAAQCQKSLGDILHMQNKYAEAEKMLRDAMRIFGKIGDQLGAAQCQKILGDILHMKNKYTEAEKMVGDAMSIFEKIGNQSGAAQCQKILGDILHMKNQYTEAEKMVGDAMSTFEKIGNQLGVAQCQQSLGNILYMQSKYAEAEKMLGDAMSTFERISNQSGVAQCQQSLEDILSRKK